MVTVSDIDLHPGPSGGAEPSQPSSGADAETAVLPVAAGPSATGEGASRRGNRAERRAGGVRLRIPWAWGVVGLIALALVGRGVVVAALGPGRGAPSTAATGQQGGQASPAPVATPSSSSTVIEDVPPTMAPTPPQISTRIALPRAEPSAPATSVPTPTSTATGSQDGSLSCSVQAEVGLFWGGYNATLTLKNTGRAPVSGWVLTFRFKGQERLADGWSGTFTEKGGRVRVTGASYNETLPPGGSTKLGYQAQFGPVGPGGPGPFGPTGFALDGVPCS